MGFGYKRTDLQKLAEGKLADAVLLLENRRFTSAYYLAGYAVELGLKACAARQIVAETIPDKDWVNKIFTHTYKSLVGVAGLQEELKSRELADSVFAANWAVVSEWTPDIRYVPVDATTAQVMLNAVANPQSGVMAWIRLHW